MFTAVQPQMVLPLSHVANLLNSVRTAACTSAASARPTYHVPVAKKHSSTASKQPTKTTNKVTVTLEELGLEDLAKDITVADLCPLLNSQNIDLSHRESHLKSNYSSADSKNGFPVGAVQEDLPASQVMFSIPTSNNSRLLSRQLAQIVHQTTRGFKTKRTTSTGIGRSREVDESFSAIKYLRESLLDKVSARARQSERFKNLIGDYRHHPELQEKLKLAFAEGYSAYDKTKEKSSLANRALRMLLITLGLILFIQLIQIMAVGGNMRGLSMLNREYYEINPEEIAITFSDVKGVDEAKQELKDVVEFLADPEKFKALGAKLPKGVLLVGPPGIGKTLLARAVAGEAGVPFFHVSGSEFDEIFVGTGAKRVRQLFSAAKIRAPAVIFIDEIDTVGAKRTSSQIHPYANQTINQLLSEMDGFSQNEGVIVLGATNRRDNLDKALLRPGRFDVEVRVFAPDLKGRKDILELYLSKVKTEKNLDVEKLAKGTTGFTGADLENLVNQAALKAAMDNSTGVNSAHLEFAKDKVLMGPAKKSKIQDADTNWNTAYHEAGHTLVAFFTKEAVPLHKVTIIPRGMSLGHTAFVPDKEEFQQTKAQLLATMDVAMGGRVAEEVIYGSDKITTGASNDFQQATRIATAMVKQFGMSEKVGVRVFDDDAVDSGLSMLKVNDLSQATTELVDNEIKRLLHESYERAKTIIRAHATEHKALAKALIEYETLDKDDIRTILEGKKFDKALS